MSALLEFECEVCVDGYEVITIDEPEPEPDPEDDDPPTVVVFGIKRMLQPRSERTRRFDLFSNPSAFLEFVQTPDTPDAIKDFADRYGLLEPLKVPRLKLEGITLVVDDNAQSVEPNRTESLISWSINIREMRQAVELWQKSKITGDFSKIIRAIQKRLVVPMNPVPGVPVELLLKKDPLSASARLCIRPRSLLHALWAQLLLMIDGNVNLASCVQCRKWLTLEAGQGRSDKEYCSNACRMRAYRKRKGGG
jgi:hypothetical protein